ncbi:unnamed protein product [Amoebophrya sp. A120]|nr:unnamed protein product [Amoebophrya sp. A120]|eukprot:GSA120T00007543001.1
MPRVEQTLVGSSSLAGDGLTIWSKDFCYYGHANQFVESLQIRFFTRALFSLIFLNFHDSSSLMEEKQVTPPQYSWPGWMFVKVMKPIKPGDCIGVNFLSSTTAENLSATTTPGTTSSRSEASQAAGGTSTSDVVSASESTSAPVVVKQPDNSHVPGREILELKQATEGVGGRAGSSSGGPTTASPPPEAGQEDEAASEVEDPEIEFALSLNSTLNKMLATMGPCQDVNEATHLFMTDVERDRKLRAGSFYPKTEWSTETTLPPTKTITDTVDGQVVTTVAQNGFRIRRMFALEHCRGLLVSHYRIAPQLKWCDSDGREKFTSSQKRVASQGFQAHHPHASTMWWFSKPRTRLQELGVSDNVDAEDRDLVPFEQVNDFVMRRAGHFSMVCVYLNENHPYAPDYALAKERLSCPRTSSETEHTDPEVNEAAAARARNDKSTATSAQSSQEEQVKTGKSSFVVFGNFAWQYCVQELFAVLAMTDLNTKPGPTKQELNYLEQLLTMNKLFHNRILVDYEIPQFDLWSFSTRGLEYSDDDHDAGERSTTARKRPGAGEGGEQENQTALQSAVLTGQKHTTTTTASDSELDDLYRVDEFSGGRENLTVYGPLAAHVRENRAPWLAMLKSSSAATAEEDKNPDLDHEQTSQIEIADRSSLYSLLDHEIFLPREYRAAHNEEKKGARLRKKLDLEAQYADREAAMGWIGSGIAFSFDEEKAKQRKSRLEHHDYYDGRAVGRDWGKVLTRRMLNKLSARTAKSTAGADPDAFEPYNSRTEPRGPPAAVFDPDRPVAPSETDLSPGEASTIFPTARDENSEGVDSVCTAKLSY